MFYNGYDTKQLLYVVNSKNLNQCGKDLMPKVGIAITGLEESSQVNKVLDAEEQLENFSADPTLPISTYHS